MTINAFMDLENNRSELYVIDGNVKVNPHNKQHNTLEGAEKEMVTVIQELKVHRLYVLCRADIDCGFLNPYNVVVTESPAFLMRTLSNTAVYERYADYLNQGWRVGNRLGFDVTEMAFCGYDIGDNAPYAAAKFSFARASGAGHIGGLVPHTPETYYLIAHNGVKIL